MEAKGGLTINGKLYPIPPGDTPYCKAKRAEYIEKNLAKAETLYATALRNGERLSSTVKDLASVLHQQNKTAQAVKLLKSHRHLYKRDLHRFNNLLLNLEKQITPTGTSLNRCIRISHL